MKKLTDLPIDGKGKGLDCVTLHTGRDWEAFERKWSLKRMRNVKPEMKDRERGGRFGRYEQE